MLIMTWNINSLRLRMPLLQRLMADYQPDIICLQETKVHDSLFPSTLIEQSGYSYMLFKGMKSYNGVAILSRHQLRTASYIHDWCKKDDSRHIEAGFTHKGCNYILHNFYVPAGGDIPDPQQNPKFDHKLKFIDETTEWFTQTPHEKTILVGDLNIAPLPEDVWSHKQLLSVVSHTPIETQKLNRWQQSCFVDAMRLSIPAPEKLYTWWSYRNRDWKKSDRGRRLDHIWVTPDLQNQIHSIDVLKHVRDWEKPSDHVPILMKLDL